MPACKRSDVPVCYPLSSLELSGPVVNILMLWPSLSSKEGVPIEWCPKSLDLVLELPVPFFSFFLFLGVEELGLFLCVDLIELL